MRCLHCNKKLSLLKLAKGDSFCSAEHFDAHQLQLSKNAIERLMNLPGEDAPKPPLVLKNAVQKEAPHDLQEETVALARLTAFQPPPPPDVPAVQTTAMTPPPYAPFATSPLPPYSLNPPFRIANGAEASEPVAPPRELAFPVHEVDATVCILNLYLRLNLDGTKPIDWASVPHLAVSPEDFPFEITRLSRGLSPEVPQIENLAPGEPAPLIEAAPPVDAIASIETLPVVESAPSNKPLLPVEPPSYLQPIETVEPVEAIDMIDPRVPFLMAPSFRERTGAPIVLDGAPSSVPNGAALTPILNPGKLPGLDSSRAIPRTTRFAGTGAVKVQDSISHWIRSAPELPMASAFVRPEAGRTVGLEGWQATKRVAGIARPPLNASWQSMHSLGFNLPVPAALVVRPEASCLGGIDPQQLLAGTSPFETGSLFLGVLETRAVGQEAFRPILRPAAWATEFSLRAILAPVDAWKPFSSATWQNRADHLPLPASISACLESPMLPLEALPYAPACSRMPRMDNAAVDAPWLAHTPFCRIVLPEVDCAPDPVMAERGSIFSSSTILPAIAKVPDRSLKTNRGTPSLTWEPRAPAIQAPAAVKLLPIRDGAILPSARSWPKLGLVSR
jgi:hypothetical protein